MIIARDKVEGLAKRSHAKCHGTGILGYRPKANMAVVLCTCVFRNLRRRGVNINDREAVGKFLEPDPPEQSAQGEDDGR